jgi:hypothetical protein
MVSGLPIADRARNRVQRLALTLFRRLNGRRNDAAFSVLMLN